MDSQLKIIAKSSLNDLSTLIQQLNQEQYSREFESLLHNSIGSHIRHSLELYECLVESDASEILNYDNRKRSSELEKNPFVALAKIHWIQESLDKLSLEKEIQMEQTLGDFKQKITSNFKRELLYNIEHTVHHMAIIRIGVQSFLPNLTFPSTFGIAYSTLLYREENQA
ncbi:MAG: hypothetical protein ACK5IC_03260 [Moheibacter sp.]